MKGGKVTVSVHYSRPTEGRLQLLHRIKKAEKSGVLCLAYIYQPHTFLAEASLYLEINYNTQQVKIVAKVCVPIDWEGAGEYLSWSGSLNQLMEALQKSTVTMDVTGIIEFLLSGEKLTEHRGPREALLYVGFSQIKDVFNPNNRIDLRTGLARGSWRRRRRKRYRPEDDPHQLKLF